MPRFTFGFILFNRLLLLYGMCCYCLWVKFIWHNRKFCRLVFVFWAPSLLCVLVTARVWSKETHYMAHCNYALYSWGFFFRCGDNSPYLYVIAMAFSETHSYFLIFNTTNSILDKIMRNHRAENGQVSACSSLMSCMWFESIWNLVSFLRIWHFKIQTSKKRSRISFFSCAQCIYCNELDFF